MSSATPTRPASSNWVTVAAVVAAIAVVVVIAFVWLLVASGTLGALGHWLHESSIGSAIRYILESLLLLVGVLLSTAALIYIERKIWGSVQLRRGPNVVGPWGVLQPFADFLKFILKEPIIPAAANKGVFILAPLVSVVLAMAAWAVIPVGAGWVVSDINVGVLYLFAVSSLGVYGIIMAGWASNSKYPLLSALRSAAQMVSYEVSIGFVIVTVLMCAGSLNLSESSALRTPALASSAGTGCLCSRCSSSSSFRRWPRPTGRHSTRRGRIGTRRRVHGGIFGLAVPAAVPDRTRRAAYHGGDDRVLFLGGWLSPLPFPPFTWIPGVIWFLIKAWAVVFCFSLVNAFVPRYRYDQLMRLGWKVFLPISLFMVVLVAAVLEFTGARRRGAGLRRSAFMATKLARSTRLFS